MADDTKNIQERLHTLYKAAKLALAVEEKNLAKATVNPSKEDIGPSDTAPDTKPKNLCNQHEWDADEPCPKCKKDKPVKKADEPGLTKAEAARQKNKEFWASREQPYDEPGFKYEE